MVCEMNINVGILPKNTTNAEFAAFFIANGAVVTGAVVLHDEMSGVNRRLGRAQATDPADVVAKCNGKLLGGSPMTVRRF
jgi:hypothetical protein